MKKLICSTFREGYGIDQIRRTMTAGELINFLAQYDEDTPVYLSFDNGYTYGGIKLLVAILRNEDKAGVKHQISDQLSGGLFGIFHNGLLSFLSQ